MTTSSALTESLEDYLESIYRNILKKGAARVKDIAGDLNVRYPSVTSALKNLERRGLIRYEPYGTISLTKAGLGVALGVTERHRLLRSFFSQVLGVEQGLADETACRIEHVLPPEAYERFVQFMKFLFVSKGKNKDWLKGFRAFVEDNAVDATCPECVEEYFAGTGFDLKGGMRDAGDA